MQFNDYGWKEPYKIWETKDSGTRVGSMLDKRTAVLHELYRQKDRAHNRNRAAGEFHHIHRHNRLHQNPALPQRHGDRLLQLGGQQPLRKDGLFQ